MARARVSINPLYEGGAGGYSFYTRDGEQIVRQRKNNSNYGESASRSEYQMRRRVKWGNLVNLFKSMKTWQPKAYDSKKKGQTDYNMFVSLNINTSRVCLTKDQARNGCAVMDAYQISRGSLPPVSTALNLGGTELVTDIVITSAISSTRPVGNLSQDIITNNPQFKEGDNIAIVMWSQFVDSRQYPYIVCAYTELTLDTESETPCGSLDAFMYLSSTNATRLALTAPGSSFGEYTYGAVIHTRKSSSLEVSTQNAVAFSTTVTERFSTFDWQQTCIESYGLDETVPLDPFEPGPDPLGRQTHVSGTLVGRGQAGIESAPIEVVPGTYLIKTTPNRWAITEIEGNVGIIGVHGENSGGTTVINQTITADTWVAQGGTNSIIVDVPAGSNFLRLFIRADEGVNVKYTFDLLA